MPPRAFPGAEGYGALACTPCSRSNVQVLFVTNTNDTGAGSYRQAVADVDAKTDKNRLSIIIFRVAGHITLGSNQEHPTTAPCMYVAGQTAPGSGILIRSTKSAGSSGANARLRFRNKNFVFRYLTLAVMHPNMHFEAAGDFIVDHVTSMWSPNMGGTVTTKASLSATPPAANITVQRSVFAEALAFHPTGLLVSVFSRWEDIGSQYNIDVHHNLFHTNNHRNPMMGGGGWQPLNNPSGTPRGNRFINNVAYNWRTTGFMSGFDIGVFDVIANYYKRGPATTGEGLTRYELTTECGVNYTPGGPTSPPTDGDYPGHVFPFATGNLSPRNSDPNADNFTGSSRMWSCMGWPVGGVHDKDPSDVWYNYVTGAVQANPSPTTNWKKILQRRFTPLPGPAHEFDVTQELATDAYASIVTNRDVGNNARLDCEGNWITREDEVQTRLLDSAASGSGFEGTEGTTGLFDDPPTAFPTVDAGNACVDTNNDGVPDAYVARYNLDEETDYSSVIVDPDGWTVLENYLHGRAPDGSGGAPPPDDDFPKVISQSQGNSAPVSSTSHVLTLPTGTTSGVRVVCALTGNQLPTDDITAFAWPAGWTELDEVSTASQTFSLAYRDPSGPETDVTVTSTGSGTSVYWCGRIEGFHSDPPQVGTAATGSSTSPDPPPLTPSWGSAETLWLAFSSLSNPQTHSAYPANYTNGVTQAGPSGSVAIGVARRELEAPTEDPGAFTQPTGSWAAQTMAIRPLFGGGGGGGGEFPVVESSSDGISRATAGTDHTITLPAGAVAGDLLIACIIGGPVTSFAWNDDGFTELGTQAVQANHVMSCAYKVSDGTEGATTTVTSVGSTVSKFAAYRISGQHPTTVPEVGTMAKGSSPSPDPPAVTPSWGSENNLVIAVAGLANAHDITGFPYTDNQVEEGVTGTDNIGACTDELTDSPVNPSAFTQNTTGSWLAQTIVVRPTESGPGEAITVNPNPVVLKYATVTPVVAVGGTVTLTPSPVALAYALPVPAVIVPNRIVTAPVVLSFVIVAPTVSLGGAPPPEPPGIPYKHTLARIVAVARRTRRR